MKFVLFLNSFPFLGARRFSVSFARNVTTTNNTMNVIDFFSPMSPWRMRHGIDTQAFHLRSMFGQEQPLKSLKRYSKNIFIAGLPVLLVGTANEESRRKLVSPHVRT